jgi:diguanylate cyclase (GGDEF)-like protein/hemerythrin-like metal-binding protein/PAS domain S-box-containing protein
MPLQELNVLPREDNLALDTRFPIPETPIMRRRHDDPWLDRRHGRWTLLDGEAKARLLEQVGVGVFVLKGSRLVYLNDSFASMLGYALEDIPLGREWFDFVDVRDQAWLASAIEDVMNGQKKQVRRGFRAVKMNGSLAEMSVNLVRGEIGGERVLIGSTPESFANRLAVSQLTRLAFYDALTELPGKTLFFDRMYQAICQARRDQHHFALMLLDLDGFKSINDRFGHAAGDELLKQVARRLVDCIRESDSAARIGGDEFTFILRKVEAPQDAALVAEKLIASLKAPIAVRGEECQVGASVGIGIYPEDGDTIETLLRAADQAMYRSKRKGKNTYSYFGPADETPAELTPRLNWSREFESGIREVDEQHRVLFDMLNRIFDDIGAGCDSVELERHLKALSRYARFHFVAEEIYMERHGSADKKKHRQDHKKLIEEIDSIMGHVDMERNSVTVLLEFLKDWLMSHLRKFDAPMGEELCGMGVC